MMTIAAPHTKIAAVVEASVTWYSAASVEELVAEEWISISCLDVSEGISVKDVKDSLEKDSIVCVASSKRTLALLDMPIFHYWEVRYPKLFCWQPRFTIRLYHSDCFWYKGICPNQRSILVEKDKQNASYCCLVRILWGHAGTIYLCTFTTSGTQLKSSNNNHCKNYKRA